jgi:hypothetical protein
MKTAMAVLALMLSVPAGAKPVYKCEEKGVITYTDRPCSPGAAAAELPDVIVTTPPTRSEQDLARAHEERLARDQAERDRADAQWLKEHAEAQARAERERAERERPKPGKRKR